MAKISSLSNKFKHIFFLCTLKWKFCHLRIQFSSIYTLHEIQHSQTCQKNVTFYIIDKSFIYCNYEVKSLHIFIFCNFHLYIFVYTKKTELYSADKKMTLMFLFSKYHRIIEHGLFWKGNLMMWMPPRLFICVP